MSGPFKVKPPTNKAERVVVDEVFENGTVRLLRAKRIKNLKTDDLGVETWGDEEEEILDGWRVAAFVGYPSRKQLNEGDVFFIADSTKLNDQYRPISRANARKKHLLCPWDDSRKLARTEIKRAFYKVSAATLASSKKEKEELFERIDEKIIAMSKNDNEEGGE